MALTVRYTHMWEEMYKGIDEQGPYYEVVYLFDNWADSDLAANELLGYATRIGSTTFRSSPHQHPLSPNLYCRSARVEGIGGPILNTNGLPNYAGGFKVRALYRAWVSEGITYPGDDPSGLSQIDPTTPVLWCTQEIDFDEDTEIVNNSAFVYGSDGKKIVGSARITIDMTVMRLTFHRLPYFPMTVIRTLRGKVNNAVFLGAAIDTVRFKGAQTTREWDSTGQMTQRLSMTFIERQHGWNSVYRPDLLVWDTILDGGGAGPYTPADLSPLLAI